MLAGCDLSMRAEAGNCADYLDIQLDPAATDALN